jgi:hypothetical protein
MLKKKWFKKLKSTNLRRTPLKSIWTNRLNRIKTRGKETDIYDQVYEYYNWKCILTNQFISVKQLSCFPHLFNKWMYEEYRLLRNNIVLVQSHLHEAIDQIFNIMKQEIWIKELEEKIKSWEDLAEQIRMYYKRIS